jgi:hypothetical protein
MRMKQYLNLFPHLSSLLPHSVSYPSLTVFDGRERMRNVPFEGLILHPPAFMTAGGGGRRRGGRGRGGGGGGGGGDEERTREYEEV